MRGIEREEEEDTVCLYVNDVGTQNAEEEEGRKVTHTHTHTLTTISGTDRWLAALVLLNPTRYIAAPSLIRSQAHSMASLSLLLLLLLLPSYCWLGKPLCIYSCISTMTKKKKKKKKKSSFQDGLVKSSINRPRIELRGMGRAHSVQRHAPS